MTLSYVNNWQSLPKDFKIFILLFLSTQSWIFVVTQCSNEKYFYCSTNNRNTEKYVIFVECTRKNRRTFENDTKICFFFRDEKNSKKSITNYKIYEYIWICILYRTFHHFVHFKLCVTFKNCLFLRKTIHMVV